MCSNQTDSPNTQPAAFLNFNKVCVLPGPAALVPSQPGEYFPFSFIPVGHVGYINLIFYKFFGDQFV